MPAEREQDIERQVQKLRAMYQRAKMLAEKETESCLQCLSKVDDLIFKKTGEHMPQPAALLGAKRTFSSHDMGIGKGVAKRQMLGVDTSSIAWGKRTRRAVSWHTACISISLVCPYACLEFPYFKVNFRVLTR